MGSSVTVTTRTDDILIVLSGRFDFAMHDEFKMAYESVANPERTVVVNMRDVEYLDSSALGMLLLLREHLGEDQADVRIEQCGGEIRKILKIAQFEKLFEIT